LPPTPDDKQQHDQPRRNCQARMPPRHLRIARRKWHACRFRQACHFRPIGTPRRGVRRERRTCRDLELRVLRSRRPHGQPSFRDRFLVRLLRPLHILPAAHRHQIYVVVHLNHCLPPRPRSSHPEPPARRGRLAAPYPTASQPAGSSRFQGIRNRGGSPSSGKAFR